MSTPTASLDSDLISNIKSEIWEIPRLGKGQKLDLKAIRDSKEKFYLKFVYLPTVITIIILIGLPFLDNGITIFLIVIGYSLLLIPLLILLRWISWQFVLATLRGDGIKVGPSQYPQLHSIVGEASEVLGIDAPTVFILQGHGLFELFVIRRFSRRGILIITSNMLDDLTEHRSSRELMFFIGRQLGLIATGYFRFWTLKHTIGQFSLFFYWAWRRHANVTADRLGLLVAGELYAAEQALLIITAGSGIASNTNFQALKEQRTELFGKFWAWINLGFSTYPYMVDRLILMREFAFAATRNRIQSNAPLALGALPIAHRPIRAIPLMIVHGHDAAARLELENFLLKHFPHVQPIAMIDKSDSAFTLPEKFERMASAARGALAILTPDDLAVTLKTNTESVRARQNVIFEVGWFSAKFGRGKCLLLVRGDVEIPSDLSGVETHRFVSSLMEQSESVREFIAAFELM
jgi:Zn-dependent protease with chaperone function